MSAQKFSPPTATPPEVRPPAERKPYVPPRILSREPLEAMAATCNTPGLGKAALPCTLVQS